MNLPSMLQLLLAQEVALQLKTGETESKATLATRQGLEPLKLVLETHS